MAFLDRIKSFLGRKPKPTYRRLIRSADLPSPAKMTEPSVMTYARRPLLKLEQLYFTDPIIFNAINTWVELICTPGYDIVGEDEEARKYIEKWLEDIEFEDEILPKIVNHMCVYGNAFCEIVYNKAGTEIVDLSDPIDPKTIDFQRDSRGIPKVDEYGNPIGYIQWGSSGQKIELDATQIAHFKLYSLGAILYLT